MFDQDNDEEFKRYFDNTICPLLRRVKNDVMVDQPKDMVDYIVGWMQREKTGQNVQREAIEQSSRQSQVIDEKLSEVVDEEINE